MITGESGSIKMLITNEDVALDIYVARVVVLTDAKSRWLQGCPCYLTLVLEKRVLRYGTMLKATSDLHLKLLGMKSVLVKRR
jgi:hypothetical protein